MIISRIFLLNQQGVAVAETFEKDDVLANVLARGEQLKALARGLQQRKPEFISDVRGWGLIVGTSSLRQSYFIHTAHHLIQTLILH